MLPVNSGGHAAYQNFVVENLRKYYPDPLVFSKSTWDIIERFWNLDLSYTDELLRSKYSVFGPRPRTPSCMQRSYLLSIDFKVSSITDWAAQLKINPLFAVLSGFDFGDTPGVGTFYNFFGRLWDSDSDNLSPHIHPVKKKKVKKPKQKGIKAESVEKVTVDQLFNTLVTTPSCNERQSKTDQLSARDSKEWKQEYNARTSAERSNKREKIDFQLESGRHRSTKMWYCRLYHILMLQHLDAWDLPFESTLRKLICNVA